MEPIKTVLVDDERHALNYLRELCRACPELSVEAVFSNPHEAMEYILRGGVQLAIMDIEMPELSGMMIAREITRRGLPVGVILVTGYEQYALEAYQNDVAAYLLKPARPEDLSKAVRKAVKITQPAKPHVFIRTFGHFDVFIDQEPVYFSSNKAKELLAFLVDRRGGTVSMDTVAEYLWENHPYDDNVKQLYRKAVNYLNKLFEKHGLGFFVSNRGSCYIKTAQVSCDLFDLFAGKPYAAQDYHGEYMVDYSWGEATVSKIEAFVHR